MPGFHGVILAGGISSRMGFPKALMPFGNSFFLLRVYEQVSAAGIAPIHMIINSGLRSSLEAQISKFPEGRFIPNMAPAKGQIHSLRLGIQAAAAEGADGVIVTLVDLPFININTFSAVAQKAAATPGKVIVPQFMQEHGHPIAIPKDRFDAFVNAADGQTARDVMHANPDWIVYLEVNDNRINADVDSPEDMQKYSTSADDID